MKYIVELDAEFDPAKVVSITSEECIRRIEDTPAHCRTSPDRDALRFWTRVMEGTYRGGDWHVEVVDADDEKTAIAKAIEQERESRSGDERTE